VKLNHDEMWNLCAKFIVEQFDSIDLTAEMFRIVDLFLLNDLSTGLDDILYFTLCFTHQFVEFLHSFNTSSAEVTSATLPPPHYYIPKHVVKISVLKTNRLAKQMIAR